MKFDYNIDELIEFDLEESKKLIYPLNLVVTRAENSYFYDINNKQYLDFTSNLDNNSLGYNNFVLKNSIQENLNRPIYFSKYVNGDIKTLLASKINDLTHLSGVYFSNSALEAYNTSLMLVKTWLNLNNFLNEKEEVIILSDACEAQSVDLYNLCRVKSSNSRTLPVPLAFISSYMLDSSTLKNIFSRKTSAIIIDPLVFENGRFVSDSDILQIAREFCDKYQSLLVFDLSTFAVGRTGRLIPELSIEPDLMILSKGLSQGIPFGVTAFSQEVMSLINNHYQHPYGSPALACHISCGYLDYLKNSTTLQQALKVSDYLFSCLNELQEKYISILDVQHKGLLFYIEMDFNLSDFALQCLQEGVLIEIVGTRFIRLTPPFSVTNEEINQLCRVFDKLLGQSKSTYRLK